MEKWIEEQYDCIKVNGKRYYFRCNFCYVGRRSFNSVYSVYPSLQLDIIIYDEENDKWLTHKEYKGTYLAEKLNDYIRNTLNGQRTMYWNNDKERNFD